MPVTSRLRAAAALLLLAAAPTLHAQAAPRGAPNPAPTPVSGATVSGATVPRPPVPGFLRHSPTLYDIRGEVEPLDESRELADALGLASLDSARMPTGAREIRLYSGVVIGYPRTALVVRQEGGPTGRVSGRLVRYWPLDPRDSSTFDDYKGSAARYAALEPDRCGPVRTGRHAQSCDLRFDSTPDWRAILGTIDSVDAWTLVDGSKVPHGYSHDGHVIRGETRRDTSYTRFHYQNPETYRRAEGYRAWRLMRLVNDVVGYLPPPADIAHVRGLVLVGRDTTDFVPCAAPHAPGRLEGSLSPLVRAMGDSAWLEREGPTKVYLMTGWFRETVRADTVSSRTPDAPARIYARRWELARPVEFKEIASRRCAP